MLRSGLIGRAITKSRSPWLHEQEAHAQGLDLSYRLFDFNELGLEDGDLGRLLDDLRAEGFSGVNVTYPFKQTIMPLLDELAESAALVGAVNTIAIRDGRLTGHNTDMEGFRDSVVEGLPGAPLDRVLQMGAGGAGAAVGCALLSLGVERLDLCDVDLGRAQALAQSLAARFGEGRVVARDIARLDTSDLDGIVNATPMGMAAHPQSAIAADRILSRHWVADIVYFPLETEMLRIARGKGCRVLDGSGMVISQAAKAFELITGHAADSRRMRNSFGVSDQSVGKPFD